MLVKQNAKGLRGQELDGSFRVEFGYLEAYAAAIKRTNLISKAEVELCNFNGSLWGCLCALRLARDDGRHDVDLW